ncbi:hypothetical protein DYBT9275_01336 [Dyadobacter sp. CECT 9275]|uniref:GAF domain-containing protein n=1 Tax=Dyadobacter helix TaxID=2822344 RepID=A0A916J9L9_9BACT|nr:GAF domain-containing protein [Dyadobacter sp. CECT 9275]CAG4994173.1 hypothetical protein DYBT9275_01336 [Dyadobacter sp. CECT 9275]
MKSIIIDVSKDSPLAALTIDASISFRKYVSHLENKIQQETSIRRSFFEMVVNRLKADPAFLESVPLGNISKYEEQLALVYDMLVPPVTDEKSVLWAISTPISPIILYGTDAFYNLMIENSTGEVKCGIMKENSFSVTEKVQMVYAFVLEKLYNFPAIHSNDLIITLKDDVSGLQKFYKLNIDNSFTTVSPKGELPELNLELLRRRFQANEDLSLITDLLPLSLFRFEGFSIITLTDVTSEHSVENIKNVILNRSTFDSKTFFSQVTESLKGLVENQAIEFGMMPMLKVNNKLVFQQSTFLNSKLISAAAIGDLAEKTYLSMAESYFSDPKLIFMRSFTEEDEKYEFIRILKTDGIQSYGLLPVYFDNRIVGVLEVYTYQANLLDEKLISRLDMALPLIAQILHNSIEEFNAGIENVIREKFTSLQPAVQWKFKDAAWHYLRDKTLSPSTATIESINFKNVYPLYGAIDIRNSTIERNLALRNDLRLQFNVLIETFSVLKKQMGFGLADEMVFKCKKWLAEIVDESNDNDEMKIRDFLETEVHPFLMHFRENRVIQTVPALAGSAAETEIDPIAEAIDSYFDIIDEQNGAAFAQRRALEISMQKINSSVNLYLDLFKNEIQLSYPTYFEKFRTDGIEYDIYIGQAIDPNKPFSHLYLKNIRLWQLTSMAAIARITHSLLPQMEKHLRTTQLIFINSGSIDISFRDDERRFDVEGAYNIRYQIIKKRIDKVHVKGTGERLTQPGKIAMVYFNNKSAEEYVDYIRYLQEQNTLLDDLEYLDLEELQGVNGLKALRIGVNLDSEWN